LPFSSLPYVRIFFCAFPPFANSHSPCNLPVHALAVGCEWHGARYRLGPKAAVALTNITHKFTVHITTSSVRIRVRDASDPVPV
jgi:hypothetical protein